MSKVILMVFTTVAEKMEAREVLITKYPSAKYSDFALETEDTLYKFHVVNMDPVFTILRDLNALKDSNDYSEIVMNSVVDGLKTLYKAAVRICGIDAIKKPEPVVTGEPKEVQPLAEKPITEELKKENFNIGNEPEIVKPEIK